MNLYAGLAARAAEGNPIRVAVIGAGKFASMFLAQARRTPGLHLAGIADLLPERAREALARTGWPEAQTVATSLARAVETGGTFVTDDGLGLIAGDGIDVVVDVTGDPAAGIRHALACIEHGRHTIMVNVEADVLAGPLLAARARAAGLVYSMAYGDQPALICELVDSLRASGFDITAAGKGTKYMPEFHRSTPDTVWGHYGLTPERAALAGMNPKMFNSFLDGTKSAIEMAAVANATGLTPQRHGLAFPPAGTHDLATVCRPQSTGGTLERSGVVEVVSCVDRDGRPVPNDLRWGVYAVFEAHSDYVANCFEEYGLVTDDSGRYAAQYKPYHLIGLELGVSVASAALRGEPTGSATGFRGDVVATAKRGLKAGEMLDGEGGFTVYGRLMPAADSLALGGLPLGLAHNVKLKRDIAMDAPVRWTDVELDMTQTAVRLRREMETTLAPPGAAAAQ